MSTTTETAAAPKKPVATSAPNEPVTKKPFWWIHVGGLIAQVPLLVVYFRALWDQPHYQFFPIALGVVFFLSFRRVDWSKGNSYNPGVLAFTMLFLSMPFLLGASLLFEPSLGAIGAFFYAGSILVSLRDQETGRTLFPLWLILAVIVQPPGNGDMDIIVALQFVTSDFSSTILDYLGVYHIPNGKLIELIDHDKPLGVAEQCSGVQSLFTLLFCSIAFAVIFRRPWFRSLVLVVSAVFWALFMNTMRVTIIAYALAKYNIDWTTGVSHALLGYVMLGIAILMIVSTDFFLTFLFGPVGEDEEGGNPAQRFMQKAWNRIVAGNEQRRSVQPHQPSKMGMPVIGLSAFAILLGVIPLLRLGPGVFISKAINPITYFTIDEEVCSEDFNDWKFDKHAVDTRELNSEWGKNSDIWRFVNTSSQSDGLACSISCDYPFTGWHELTNCYRGAGFAVDEDHRKELTKDDVVSIEIDKQIKETVEQWPVIEVKFKNAEGTRMLILFSLIDKEGNFMAPPSEERFGMNFVNRVIAAIKRRIDRPYGPDKPTYQVQLSYQHFKPLTGVEMDAIRQHFLYQREKIREFIVNKQEED